MKKQNESLIADLLNQLSLVEPPESLDKAISQIAEYHRQKADMPFEPIPSATQFSWTTLLGASLACSLLGLLVGYSIHQSRVYDNSGRLNPEFVVSEPPIRLKQVALFEKLHGHSADERHQQCSKCHIFKSKNEQIMEKWDYHDMAASLNCAFCHRKSKSPEKAFSIEKT